MPRRCGDFLESYLEYVKNTESPTSYHIWSGISVVSSALERKVYMRWGHTDIYPNQYIVLIGPSGVRKAEPLGVAKRLLNDVGAHVVSGATTKQRLIQRMSQSMNNFNCLGKIKLQCAMTCIAEELSVFIGNNDASFLADLTDWYDSGDKWVYDTKHEGTDEIIGVCFNMLASMAPSWIPLTFPTTAIGGGLTSRMMYVVEHRKGRVITNPNLLVIDANLRDNLERDLECIKRLSGRMEFDAFALREYETWYAREEQRTAAGRPAIQDPRFAGYVSRRATHVKKIAMAVSVARSDSMVISLADFRRALALMEHAEINMPDVFGRVGKSALADVTEDIRQFIKARGTCTRSQVMQQFYREVDGKTIETIESTLMAARFIDMPAIDTNTNERTYRWRKGQSPSSQQDR